MTNLKNEPYWVKFSYQDDLSKLIPIWNSALKDLGCVRPEDRGFFKTEGGTSYLNLSLLLETITQDALTVSATSGDFPTSIAKHGKTSAFFRLVKAQLRMIDYVETPPKQNSPEANQIRSLALGMCQQFFLMQLAESDPKIIARWLCDSKSAPRGKRKAIDRINKIQRERNRISTSLATTWNQDWMELTSNMQKPVAQDDPTQWEGLPVCPGVIEGAYRVITSDTHPSDDNTVDILIFSQARADAVLHYPKARAVIFAEGGVLSHACSVAREQGIPCVTAVGKEFLKTLSQLRPERLTINGELGLVRFTGLRG